MADFDTLEASVQDSRPAELYEFTIGNLVFRYTSAGDAIAQDGQTYLPRTISRSNVQLGVDLRARVFDVSIPADDAVAAFFSPRPPVDLVLLKMKVIQRDETPVPIPRLRFSGTVRAAQLDVNLRILRLSAVSLESDRAIQIPRDRFSALCNNQLYDSDCGVNPSLHQFVGVCSAKTTTESGPTITVTGAGATPHKWKGGIALIVGTRDMRSIIKQSADDGGGGIGVQVADLDVLTIVSPFNADPVGQDVLLRAGCDHQLQGDCAKVFDNVRRFRGWQYVPTKSPWATGLT